MDKIGIWGTGNFFLKLSRLDNALVDNACVLIDSDLRKQGELSGKEVIDPKSIAEYNLDTVIVAIKNDRDVIRYLKLNYPNIHVKRMINLYCDRMTKSDHYNMKELYRELKEYGMIETILSSFDDDETKNLFMARSKYALTGEAGGVYETLIHLSRTNGSLPIYDGYSKSTREDLLTLLRNYYFLQTAECFPPLVLCGYTSESLSMIKKLELKIDAVILREGNEDIPMGMKSISLDELIAEMPNANVISGMALDGPMRRQLIKKGLSGKQFFMRHTCWKAQYFDEPFLQADENEILVDAGAYDLNNSLSFMDWCQGKYEKIYAFEPDVDNYNVCKLKIEKKALENIELYNAATWKEDSVLRFNNVGNGSSSIVEGNENVSMITAKSIDSVLMGRRVTFIKMDVEGSELESLKGAAETIKKWRPRLAICVYHKPEDIWVLPIYILSLVPDYKMYIRHYSTCLSETVLYCI